MSCRTGPCRPGTPNHRRAPAAATPGTKGNCSADRPAVHAGPITGRGKQRSASADRRGAGRRPTQRMRRRVRPDRRAAAPTDAASPAPAARRALVHLPRSLITATGRPSSARAAVAPSATSLRPRPADLALEPVQAGRDLALRRRLVHAALAAQLELEVLDRVGHVQPLARRAQPRASARSSSRPAGPTNGRPAGPPDRRAARRRASASAPAALAEYDCVAFPPIGHSRQRSSACARSGSDAGRSKTGTGWFGSVAADSAGRRRDGAVGTNAIMSDAPSRRCRGERRDQLRLRQIAPVAARHLALHHRELEPGRVEDALVVRQPERSPASAGGASSRRAPGPNSRSLPSHRTLRSGVRIDQRICAKRRAKNGATASTT